MGSPRLYQAELLKTLSSLDIEKVSQAIRILAQARDEERRIFVCGNGGSAATASHFATDLVKGASFGHAKRFRILALNDSIPTLTAYSNDVGFDCIFAEQLKNFAQPGDVLIAISTSGNSPNVLCAVECGNAIGCHTIALTGDGGKLGAMARLHIPVAHRHTGRLEDSHMVILHMIAYYFMEEESAHRPAE